jgi:eukaryotic-like serine/threonine-protein kinase
MSTPTPGIPLDRLRDTWSEVSGRLEALAAAWESGIGEPPLGVLLSEARHVDTDQRRLILVELIKADLEYRFAPGRKRRTIEDYLAEFPELRDPAVPSELLFEEYHLRKQAGESVEPREYYRRFPEIASELARLLGDDPTTIRTMATNAPVKLNRLESLKEGQTLDEFELIKLLGKGSFARVYLAWQKSMHRLVGLKVSTAHGVEPQALAQLDHPNIVHVFDRRTLAEQGFVLLYMTYLPGGTLDDVLRHVRGIPLAERTGAHLLESVDRRHSEGANASALESSRMRPTRRRIACMTWPHMVCWLGARLAEALDHAHRRGILHRDIKPANILLTADGSPQLADFNVGSSDKSLGAEIVFGGSLGYMAPEHLEAIHPLHPRGPDGVDARADLYSLAVTLWELLAGKRPFAVDRVPASGRQAVDVLLEDRRHGPAPDRRAALEKEVPEELVAALCRCLEPDPNKRFARPVDFAQALEQCLNPRAQKLLRMRPTGWGAAMRRWPEVWLVLLAAVPNIIGSMLNIAYNDAAVVSQHANAEGVFQVLIAVINAVLFSGAIALVLRRARPVLAAVRRSETTPPSADLRRHALAISTDTAVIGVICWAIAGLLWPIVLSRFVPLSVDDWLHFLTSLVMCGVMSAVHTFFVTAVFGVRVLLPVLWRKPESADRRMLHAFDRRLNVFLALAFAVPFLGIALISVFQAQTPAGLFAMRWLSAAGLFGALFALALDRWLRHDTETLQSALDRD